MLFELFRRRIGYLRKELKERMVTEQRERTIKLIQEAAADQYGAHIKQNIIKNKARIIELQNREILLREGIIIEQEKRLENVKQSKAIMENINNQYMQLLRSLEDKEYILLQLKTENNEIIEQEFTCRVKEKEIAKLRQQNTSLQNHIEEEIILMQTKYLKVLY